MSSVAERNRVGSFEFVIYCIFAIAGSVIAIAIGEKVATTIPLKREHIEGLGFLFFVNHLLIMAPLQVIVQKVSAMQTVSTGCGSKVAGMKALLEESRNRRIEPIVLYFSIAAQTIVLAFGLGLIPLSLRWFQLYFLAEGLTLWRFFLARLDCERQGSMHLQSKETSGQFSRVLNSFTDLPWLLTAIWLAFSTDHAFWLFAAAQILAYSFLVRAGHYELFKGPVTYVVTLFSLFINSILLLSPFLFPRAIDWQSVTTFICGLFLGGWWFYLIRTVKVPRRQKVLPAVLSVTLFLLSVLLLPNFIDSINNLSIDFSVQTSFSAPVFDAKTFLAILIAFTLPLGFYEALMQLAEALQWGTHEEEKRRNPF